MTARVELLVDRVENARFIPLESVFERGGRLYCWVLREEMPEVQEILTGLNNENYIVVEAGLEPGEKVLLSDPSDGGSPLGGEKVPDFLDIVSPPTFPATEPR